MGTIAGAAIADAIQGATFAVRKFTFSNSYLAGGEAITPAQFGLSRIFYAVAVASTATAGAVANIRYDPATGKLAALTTTAEVANAVDLSGVSCDVMVWGKP
jgi:uncharacterized membrane protein YfbV (UPF0208 family)